MDNAMSALRSQDVFNKCVTVYTMIIASILAVLSWLLHKQIDASIIALLLSPNVPHTVHQISNKVADKAGSNGTSH